jgi:hypothetical protein
MGVSRVRPLSAALMTACLLAACGSVDPSPEPPTAAPSLGSPETSPSPSVAAPSLEPVTLADAEDCPVTQTTVTPPEIGERLFGSHSAYGNEDLWAGGLGDNGIYTVGADYPDPDGSIGIKIGWWRNVSGSVVISGRRLDAPAPPLVGRGSDGYGRVGFQASGVSFPGEGCWEVTGRVGESELTFVMFLNVSENA